MREDRREDWVEGAGWRSALVIGTLALATTLPAWGAGAVREARSAWAELGAAVTGAGSAEREGASAVASPSVEGWLEVMEREGLEGVRRRLREEEHAGRATASGEVPGLIREGARAAADGRPAAAVRIFTLAVMIDPARPDAYSGLAEACLQLGDAGCARRAYRALARTLGAGAQLPQNIGIRSEAVTRRMRFSGAPTLTKSTNRYPPGP